MADTKSLIIAVKGVLFACLISRSTVRTQIGIVDHFITLRVGTSYQLSQCMIGFIFFPEHGLGYPRLWPDLVQDRILSKSTQLCPIHVGGYLEPSAKTSK